MAQEVQGRPDTSMTLGLWFILWPLPMMTVKLYGEGTRCPHVSQGHSLPQWHMGPSLCRVERVVISTVRSVEVQNSRSSPGYVRELLDQGRGRDLPRMGWGRAGLGWEGVIGQLAGRDVGGAWALTPALGHGGQRITGGQVASLSVQTTVKGSHRSLP